MEGRLEGAEPVEEEELPAQLWEGLWKGSDEEMEGKACVCVFPHAAGIKDHSEVKLSGKYLLD